MSRFSSISDIPPRDNMSVADIPGASSKHKGKTIDRGYDNMQVGDINFEGVTVPQR